MPAQGRAVLACATVGNHTRRPSGSPVGILRGMPTTTIKVPKELRDRLATVARRDNVTLATAIERALDTLDERAFWDAVRRDNAALTDDERSAYISDATASDDL
jgi:predicted transcriptional regulator